LPLFLSTFNVTTTPLPKEQSPPTQTPKHHHSIHLHTPIACNVDSMLKFKVPTVLYVSFPSPFLSPYDPVICTLNHQRALNISSHLISSRVEEEKNNQQKEEDVMIANRQSAPP
jgi:hypothetical protein